MANTLTIFGEVERPQEFSFDRIAALGEEELVIDVRRLGLKLGGDAVRLSSLLELAGCRDSAKYLGVHATSDDYHVSVPLAAVRESALLVFRANGSPLDEKAGGPFRFFVPDHVPCRTGDIDACANVKFVDRIELLAEQGPDSRPDSFKH